MDAASVLQDAETQLENEEGRLLRIQLELTQLKQELERKMNEKDDEIETMRCACVCCSYPSTAHCMSLCVLVLDKGPQCERGRSYSSHSYVALRQCLPPPLHPHRKNHQRQQDALQQSLEAEMKAKAEQSRQRKLVEAQIDELQSTIDANQKVGKQC